MFRKISFILIAALLSTCLTLGMGSAVSADETLYGSDYSAGDETVQAVRDAVELGGTVTLVGTFEFGVDDVDRYVNITTNVTIEGQGATIIGGRGPITCREKVNLTVRNITFEQAKAVVINVEKSTGLEVTGCTIRNVRHQYINPSMRDTAYGIYAEGFTAFLQSGFEDRLGITGQVIIKDNYIDMNVVGDDSCKAETQAGIALWAAQTNTEITGNKIYNCNTSGIVINQNGVSTLISENIIKPGPSQRPFKSFGTGIMVGSWLGNPPFSFEQGATDVTSNEIVCENPLSYGIEFRGILLKADAAFVISNNKITMSDGEGGLACLSGAKNSLWEDNKVSGSCQYGIRLDPVSPAGYGAVEDNTFTSNDLSALEAGVAQLYLDEDALGNTFSDNSFGELVHPPAANSARVIVEGNNNIFSLNKYVGTVRPWEEGHGVWLMMPHSSDNRVTTSDDPIYMPERDENLGMIHYWKDQSGDNTFN